MSSPIDVVTGFLRSFTRNDPDRIAAFDDIVEQQRPSVTDVVVRYRFTATYEGTAFEIPGVMWFSVRDDVITKRVDTWDSLTFLRQTNQTDL